MVAFNLRDSSNPSTVKVARYYIPNQMFNLKWFPNSNCEIFCRDKTLLFYNDVNS